MALYDARVRRELRLRLEAITIRNAKTANGRRKLHVWFEGDSMVSNTFGRLHDGGTRNRSPLEGESDTRESSQKSA